MSEDNEEQNVDEVVDSIKQDLEEYEKNKEDTDAHNLDESVRRELVEQAKSELKDELDVETKEEAAKKQTERLKKELEETKNELESIKKEKEDFKETMSEKLDRLTKSQAVNPSNSQTDSDSDDSLNIDNMSEDEVDRMWEELGDQFLGPERKRAKEQFE